jgi:hypothetical protein
MPRRAALLLVYALTIGAVGSLIAALARDQQSRPLTLTPVNLSGWRIVAGNPADPWVVAAQPPDTLVAQLRERVAQAAGRPLTPLPRTVLPLILRQEFEDALQGIYGIDRLMRLAEDAAVHRARFEPVCMAARAHPEHGTLLFLAMDAPEYWRYRADVEPFQPEQGGSGIFEPGALTPILPIAATSADTARWWPLKTDPLTDCITPVVVESPQPR